ncbi:2TM domain-containing protein [Spirulina subsalsa]|uniref:2TM domain-containing protein n=1 Tax=Spirulina subsalsa TaxID=54311 RepID=UPI000312F459|nr:2TM domain-containing protein [Spirulina subsalsa]
MTGSDLNHPPTYQPEEIQQILQIAIAQQDYDGELTRQQLLEIAADMEISPECLYLAEKTWLEKKESDQLHQEFDAYRQEQFQQKTIKYLLITAFFIGLDLISGGGFSWSRYILLFTSAGVAFNAWQVFQPKGVAYQRAFERWERNRQIKNTLQGLWTTVQKALQT